MRDRFTPKRTAPKANGLPSGYNTKDMKMFDVDGDANGYRNTQKEHLHTRIRMRMGAIYNNT